MATRMKEICNILDDYAERFCKDLGLQFLPAAQQPSVAVALIEFEIKLPFNRKEVLNREEFLATFKKRLNEKLTKIAEAAKNAKI